MIAAHFAIAEAARAERAAIFVYCDWLNKRKTPPIGQSTITLVTGNVETHRRHFMQQCRYTLCSRFDKDEHKQQMISGHEDAFSEAEPTQNLLWKITFPRNERLALLRHLHECNINSYTLMQDEEGLIRSLAVNVLDLAFDF